MNDAMRALLRSELAAIREHAQHAPDAQAVAAWRRGDLSHKLLPHQRRSYDAFKEWNAYRQTPEYARHVESVGAKYDDVFMNYAGRRVGKTSETILLLDEAAIALVLAGHVRAALLTYFTAFKTDISEIIVPLADELHQDAPADCKPEFFASRQPHGMGLYYPNGSVVKLVGVDKNPNGLRGRFSDGMAGSEVAFIKASISGRSLSRTIKSVLLPQFVRRPWAFLVLETSAPEDPEHCVLTEFKPDCEARGAFIERTLDDNTSISEGEYKKIIREAGGRGDPDCEREYFNVTSRDPNQYVVPEFGEHNVKDVSRPDYALCYTVADPGDSDLFALLFGYADFDHDRVVFERSWARRNASTRQVAAVIAYHEWLLWGRPPDALMSTLPLERRGGRDGWVELLVGTGAAREQCEELRELANRPQDERPAMAWRTEPDEGRFAWWDRQEQFTRQNPAARYSDVDLRFIRDLSVEFGLEFGATAKDDAGAQRQSFRRACAEGKVVCLPSAGPVIDHIKNAVWPERGPREATKWARHPIYAHFDCLAAAIYFWRNADRLTNPEIPPARLAADQSSVWVDPRWAAEQERDEVADALFGDDGGRGSRRAPKIRNVGRGRRAAGGGGLW